MRRALNEFANAWGKSLIEFFDFDQDEEAHWLLRKFSKWLKG